MQNLLKYLSAVLLWSILSFTANGQMMVTPNLTASQLAQSLVGPGVTVSNAVLNCPTNASGSFIATSTNLGIMSGIVLTSGTASNVIGPNSSSGITGNNNAAGDPDLDNLISPTLSHDACVLEFDVFVTSDTLIFNYVFGSDEYMEYVAGINDVFGLFISGPGITGTQNIALVPGTSQYVSIFNVNCNTNGTYYVCNSSASIGSCPGSAGCPANNATTSLEYDGFTTVLQAKQAVSHCNTYHIKLAVADASDWILDSGIFIQAGSLSSFGITLISGSTYGSFFANAVEGCNPGFFDLQRNKDYNDSLWVHFQLLGSAINGVDYNFVVDSILFLPGDTTKRVNIIPINDGITEGNETVKLKMAFSSCVGQSYADSISLVIQDYISVAAQNDTTVCSGTLPLHAQGSGLLPNVQLPCGANNSSCVGNQNIVVAGTGNDISADPTFFGNYSDGRILLLYHKAYLNSAGIINSGTITSIAFELTTKLTNIPYSNFSIKMGCLPANSALPSNFLTGMSTVFGPVNYSSVAGWNTFTLNNTYDWDGQSDIAIEVCYDGSLLSALKDVMNKTVTTGNTVLFAYNSLVVGCNMTLPMAGGSSGTSNKLPNCKFTICDATSTNYTYNWTPIPNVLSGNGTSTINASVNDTTMFYVNIGLTPSCPVIDSVKVYFIPPFPISMSNDTTVCMGQIINLNVSGVPTGASVAWVALNGSTIACPSCQSTTATVLTADTFIVTATTPLGCSNSDSIKAYLYNTPNANFTVQANACVNEQVTVTYTGTGTAAGNYVWNFGAGSTNISGAGQGPYVIQWANSGSQTVTLSVTENGCTSPTVSHSINIYNQITPNFSVTSPVCSQDSIFSHYTGNGGAATTFSWSTTGGTILNGTTNDTLLLQAPNNLAPIGGSATPVNVTITLTATYLSCPSVTQSNIVVLNPKPNASFTSSAAAACAQTNISLVSNSGFNSSSTNPSYSWNFAGGASSLISNNPPSYNVNWTNAGPGSINPQVSLVLVQDGCSSDTFKSVLTIYPNPIAKLSANPMATCPQVPVGVSAAMCITNAGGGAVSYNWNFTGGSAAPGSGVGPQNVSWVNGTPGNITQKVYLQLTQNGCNSNTDSVLILIHPKPISSFTISPNIICSGGISNFTFNGVTNSSGGLVNYTWNFDGGGAVPGTGVGPHTVGYVSPSNTSVHQTSLIITQDGCSDTSNQNITVTPQPNPVIKGNHTFCLGETVMLTLSPTGFPTVHWSNGGSTDTIFVKQEGNYFVNISDAAGCSGNTSFKLEGFAAPTANAGVDTTIFEGVSIQLNSNSSYGADLFAWSPPTGLSNTTSPNPICTVDKTTSYQLVYTNSTTNCSDTDEVVIVVKPCEEIMVPNAFTPNGDGYNDYFMILNPDKFYNLLHFRIYNRWGELLYQTNDKNALGWDGKFNGINQEAGTYVYSIVANCTGNKKVSLKGDVTLVR